MDSSPHRACFQVSASSTVQSNSARLAEFHDRRSRGCYSGRRARALARLRGTDYLLCHGSLVAFSLLPLFFCFSVSGSCSMSSLSIAHAFTNLSVRHCPHADLCRFSSQARADCPTGRPDAGGLEGNREQVTGAIGKPLFICTYSVHVWAARTISICSRLLKRLCEFWQSAAVRRCTGLSIFTPQGQQESVLRSDPLGGRK